MRRILIIAVAVVLITAGTVVKIRASSPPARLTPQQMAQKILATNAGKFLTAPAHAALSALANGNRNFGQDPVGGNGLQGSHGNAPPRGHAPTAPGVSNIQVNNTAEDSHQAEQTTQSETSQAVSGNNVVVGFNDSQSTLLALTPATDLTGYAYSKSGGATFTDGGVLPNAPGGVINFGDPWLAGDSDGNFYFSTLMDDPQTGSLEVGVAKSTNGGQAWTSPTRLPPPSGVSPFGYSADKDALASGTGGLYDSWDDFTFNFDPNTGQFTVLSGLPVSHSSDGGQTWSTVYAVQTTEFDSSNPCPFGQFIGAQPYVAPDGTVYDAVLKLIGDNCTNLITGEEMWIYTSHNQGATFGSGVKIADVTSSTQNFGAFVLGPGEFMRNLEFPTVASSGGNLYVAWNDGGAGDGNSHIRLATSTDAGMTWSTSFVTSGIYDEAQPAMSADSSGLHIAYYQISTANDGTGLLDVYQSTSHDGGSTFSATRVTNQSFPGVRNNPNFDPIIAPAYMGDYISDVSDGQHQYIAWGDNRNSVTDFLYPQARHDPDVFFAKQ